MCRTRLADDAHGYHVVTLTEQSLGYGVAARGILVVGHAHLLAVDVCIVHVVKGAEEQRGCLASMGGIHGDVLSEPYRTDDGAPAMLCPRIVVVLVVNSPRGVVVVSLLVLAIARVGLVQHAGPHVIGSLVGFRLVINVLGVCVEHITGIIVRGEMAQGVDVNPRLYGTTAEA